MFERTTITTSLPKLTFRRYTRTVTGTLSLAQIGAFSALVSKAGNPSVALATMTAHNLASGMLITISGSDLAGYNVVNAPVTVIDANNITYPIASVLANSGGVPLFKAVIQPQAFYVRAAAANTQSVNIGPDLTTQDFANLAAAAISGLITAPVGFKLDLDEWYATPVSGTQTLIIYYV